MCHHRHRRDLKSLFLTRDARPQEKKTQLCSKKYSMGVSAGTQHLAHGLKVGQVTMAIPPPWHSNDLRKLHCGNLKGFTLSLGTRQRKKAPFCNELATLPYPPQTTMQLLQTWQRPPTPPGQPPTPPGQHFPSLQDCVSYFVFEFYMKFRFFFCKAALCVFVQWRCSNSQTHRMRWRALVV